jgi:hypothetical protein
MWTWERNTSGHIFEMPSTFINAWSWHKGRFTILFGAWLPKGQVTGHLAARAPPGLSVVRHTNWMARLSTLSSYNHAVDALSPPPQGTEVFKFCWLWPTVEHALHRITQCLCAYNRHIHRHVFSTF